METQNKRTKWWLAWLGAGIVAFLALYPQIDLRLNRGDQWNGAYAYIDTDEVAYSAYVNALIDGRPRKNDPYTGRDSNPASPQAESLFSIQFFPAYVIALPARVLGVTASTAFTLLMGIGAALTALALFWMIKTQTDDDGIAFAGTLFILCAGTLAANQGAIQYMAGVNAAYNYLPFLRRYIPLVPFPLFFIYCGSVWRSMTTNGRQSRVALVIAIATFALLVYSYFFLWTMAAAWTACLFTLVVVVRPSGWKLALRNALVFSLFAVLALIPYFVLLSKRSPGMDAAQLLLSTHRPDLTRPPELIGFAVLIFLLIICALRRVEWKSFPLLFAITCAISPAIVFNQQVVTGRSLQPIHYEQFIANYVCLISLIAAIALFRRGNTDNTGPLKPIFVFALAMASCLWGANEVKYAINIYRDYNVGRDEAWQVSKRLKALYPENLRNGIHAPVVLSAPDLLADDLPTATSDAVLWARHMHVFSGVDLAENKTRFYKLMYYTGVKPENLREALNNGEFYYTVALFGWDRANFNLTSQPRPVTEDEVDDEVARFVAFTESFDKKQAMDPQISYLVFDLREEPDLSNFDKWYVRGDEEQIGQFKLFKVTPR